MIDRRLIGTIRKSLARYPVVGLIGCRQVGKTTLSKIITEESKDVLYLDLELTSDIAKLQDPELYLSQFSGRLVIIDAIQRIPDFFPLLRALVDKNGTPIEKDKENLVAKEFPPGK